MDARPLMIGGVEHVALDCDLSRPLKGMAVRKVIKLLSPALAFSGLAAECSKQANRGLEQYGLRFRVAADQDLRRQIAALAQIAERLERFQPE